jgi:hypothetical protein
MEDDTAREPRTLEDMEQEARWLVGFCKEGSSKVNSSAVLRVWDLGSCVQESV